MRRKLLRDLKNVFEIAEKAQSDTDGRAAIRVLYVEVVGELRAGERAARVADRAVEVLVDRALDRLNRPNQREVSTGDVTTIVPNVLLAAFAMQVADRFDELRKVDGSAAAAISTYNRVMSMVDSAKAVQGQDRHVQARRQRGSARVSS